VAHVDHEQEGRAAFVGGQGAGVALGLGAGAQQRVVEAPGGGTGAQRSFLASSTKAPRL